MTRLSKMNFHVNDLNSLHVDRSGMPYFICSFSNATSTGKAQTIPTTSKIGANIPVSDNVSLAGETPPASIPGILADVPITSPPIRHSKPGASRVLFLDFSGHVITNTAWNTSYSVARWDCLPFDTDGNTNTFSVAEQGYIIQMWERVAEDYAPFDVDITTEQPTNWTSTTGHALITPTTDANGIHLPHYGYGGIAYVGVFGDVDYSYNYASCYSPAFVLPMSGSSYANTAEAISHELGHNMGLSHDGTSTQAYYGGHGTGDISWGPIMGTGYGRNVSQWSQGEYYDANNHEDDLAIIASRAPYRADNYGHTDATAFPVVNSNGNFVVSGCIIQNTNVDVLSFATGVGAVSITSFPYRCANGTYGGNLDINAQLYNGSGLLVASNNPDSTTSAIITYSAPTAGWYYLHISNSGTGNPTNSTPTGYTSYGSLGQYFITGKVAMASGLFVQTPNGGELWYKGQTNTITWTSGTNATGNVKIELYRGSSPPITIIGSTTNSGAYAWIITNALLSATNYQMRISSLTQTSVWDMSDGGFTLAASPIATSVLFENFDAKASLPTGWSNTIISGTTLWTVQNGGGFGTSPSTAYSGAYNACLYDYTPTSDICRLSTPAVDMSGYSTGVLRFWLTMARYPPDQDYLNIWVKTNATASWLWVAGFSNSITSWTQQTIALPNLTATYMIGFAGDARYGYGVCLDDVEILGYPAEATVATNNTPLVWLADYGLPPTDDGALSDTDSDGMPAWQEWIAGTCPTQASSVLSISNSWNASNGRTLAWPTVTGRIYSVNWSSNLLDSAFTDLTTNNTTGIYTDTTHTVEQRGFYRIGVQMIP